MVKTCARRTVGSDEGLDRCTYPTATGKDSHPPRDVARRQGNQDGGGEAKCWTERFCLALAGRSWVVFKEQKVGEEMKVRVEKDIAILAGMVLHDAPRRTVCYASFGEALIAFGATTQRVLPSTWRLLRPIRTTSR